MHCVISDRQSQGAESFECLRVQCSANGSGAGLPFDVPVFTGEGTSTRTFRSLSQRELSQYRESLRKAIDAQVETFDPHLIHAQHVWLHGQLALETGVPYVLTAWGPELDEATADERFRSMAEQAAENAGCIFSVSEPLLERVRHIFEVPNERLTVLRNTPSDSDKVLPARTAHEWSSDVATILARYQHVLDERFG